METKLRLFIYGNDACRNRRPTVVEDCEDYYDEDIVVETPKELYQQLLINLRDYEEEDFEDWDEEDTPNSIEEAIIDFDSTQDYGDGSPILYAVYDLTNRRWLLGDENSKGDWLTEYNDPEEYEEEGYDFEDLAKMNIE